MNHFDPTVLLRFATDVLTKLGSSAEPAAVVAEHLVSSNLAGHDSHGILRLMQYAQHAREGRVDPTASPRVLRETPTTAILDGNGAWGQVVAHRATEIALEKAGEHALAAVTVRHCYHVGRVGVYSNMAAERGFVAQVFCNAHGVARMAPWGGVDSKMGTNPISIAVPTRGAPVLVDITTSVVAEGKVRAAKLAGREIPDDWILDRDGKPSTNPNDLYDDGTILPFGGRQGHKGYGLAVIVDLLGGVLSGAGCGFLAPVIGNGMFLQVVDPEAFMEREEFLDRVEEFLAYLRASKTREGVEEILLPGEPEQRTTAARRRDGIPLDDGTLGKLSELAVELGVAVL